MAAFGRGECFVERYLDRPRHVEAQVLADQHGNVIVVGTRDCSLQRRHQKLVEEAPAPFLTPEQRETIHSSAKAICREAGYYGAGTVEYLVGGDGTVSFLEGEHPAAGRSTRSPRRPPASTWCANSSASLTARSSASPPTRSPRGHSIEFRINGEDPGRGFLPHPARSHAALPEGPGVRVDTGIESGTVIGGNFDSLLAKVIITGETRTEALERSRRRLTR